MKELGDRHELVMIVKGIEATVYDGSQKNVNKMLAFMQEEHPDREFRIDLLVRKKGKVIPPRR